MYEYLMRLNMSIYFLMSNIIDNLNQFTIHREN